MKNETDQWKPNTKEYLDVDLVFLLSVKAENTFLFCVHTINLSTTELLKEFFFFSYNKRWKRNEKNLNVYEYWQEQAYFRWNGQIGASTGKLLMSLLNEQTPHCYIHSTQYFPFFYFTMLPIAQFSAANVWLWIIKKRGWIVIYNPTKNPIKLEENRCSSNAYTFYKNNLK